MYLLGNINPHMDTHKWRLVYKQVMRENIVKYSFNNNMKYTSIREVTIVDKNCTLTNSKKSLYPLITTL